MQQFLKKNMIEGYKTQLLQPDFALFNNISLKSNYSLYDFKEDWTRSSLIAF